ncbi:MAG: glycosyltransferase family 2 protein [Novosphingobium sp.]
MPMVAETMDQTFSQFAHLVGADVGLSVVVPCYNEQGSIDELIRRLTGVCAAAFPGRYEIVLVNDGSSDLTWPMIVEHARTSPHIVGIDLARNHGHQLALTAGLQVCQGELVLVIDADLQDPPELLPEMLKKIDDGYDVVYGQRLARHGETVFKRATAAAFYRILSKLADNQIPQDTGDFRIMTRRVVDQLNAMPERFRFIRGMVSWVGFKQAAVAYERDPRFAGETHYSLIRMLALAADAITSFSTLPLRFASILGLAFGLAGLAMLGWALMAYLTHGTITGWTSMIATILIIGSVQLLILGVFGEYLGRMYIETKHRPLFVIREIRGTRKPARPPVAIPESLHSA